LHEDRDFSFICVLVASEQHSTKVRQRINIWKSSDVMIDVMERANLSLPDDLLKGLPGAGVVMCDLGGGPAASNGQQERSTE
jgi:hypothetical protein